MAQGVCLQLPLGLKLWEEGVSVLAERISSYKGGSVGGGLVAGCFCWDWGLRTRIFPRQFPVSF
jgi:hypothetical protein